MNKVALFYGSDTGATEAVTAKIVKLLGEENVNDIDMSSVKDSTPFDDVSKIIIGIPTWYDGELQSDWEAFYPQFQKIDFTDKTVAIYGLGDQIGYAEYFVDGIGILAKTVMENGGNIVGLWSTDGYLHDESQALYEIEDEEYFLGLAIDEDNESDLTDQRLQTWLTQINEEMKLGIELSVQS